MGIYIGHAHNKLDMQTYYCGRTFGGFVNIGFGNPYNAKQYPNWRERFLDHLQKCYRGDKPESSPIITLLHNMRDLVISGDDIFLTCWCYKTPQSRTLDQINLMTCKCHTEIIAYAIYKLADSK